LTILHYARAYSERLNLARSKQIWSISCLIRVRNWASLTTTAVAWKFTPHCCGLTGLFGPSFLRDSAWKGALVMPKKRFSAEQIVVLLRQIEVLMTQGKATPVACRDFAESFNGKLRDECLNGEIFYSLREATVVIEQWRNQYNTIRPQRFIAPLVPILAST
jgi:hypothetical protein